MVGKLSRSLSKILEFRNTYICYIDNFFVKTLNNTPKENKTKQLKVQKRVQKHL